MSLPRNNYHSLLKSPVYTILADSEKIPFSVHSGLLSHHSPTLQALLSNPDRWNENKSKTINWENWNAETVSRFIEYLYSGDYEWPEPPKISQPEPESGNNSASGPVKASHDSPLPAIKEFLPVGFGSPSAKPGAQIEWLRALDTYTITSSQIENIRRAHAAVYALALYTQIQPLATLSLGNFITTLSPMSWVNSDLDAVASIIRYIYENTPHLTSENGGGGDPMREVISTFCANNHRDFVGPKVEQLLEDGGDFAVDFTKLLGKSLTWNELERVDKERKVTILERQNSVLQVQVAHALDEKCRKVLELGVELDQKKRKISELEAKLNEKRRKVSELESGLREKKRKLRGFE